jgi:adenosylcobinamide-phosphate synthase
MQPLSTVALALAALIVEAAIGYPAFVYRAIGHPVTWMGALIALLDRHLNRASASDWARKGAGVLALAILLGVTFATACLLLRLFSFGVVGIVALVLSTTSLLAQRSLYEHVRAVADALERDGLEAGRKSVSMIVGRDPDRLDTAGVARAAIESLAENFSDGIIAPAFWIAVGGLAGGALYKAANTADSMIGHRTPRHAAFGWAAARFDDLVNLPASRLTALLLIAAASITRDSAGGAWRAIWRDAPRHRSPNAGWPEAAMAGALGLSLAGPRIYGDLLVADAFMGDGRREAGAADIRRALRLYRAACVVAWLVLLAIVIIARAL